MARAVVCGCFVFDQCTLTKTVHPSRQRSSDITVRINGILVLKGPAEARFGQSPSESALTVQLVKVTPLDAVPKV